MSLAIIISSLLANLFTKFIKPSKTNFQTQEELDGRKTAIRGLNAFFGLVVLAITTIALGVELPADQVGTYIEIIVSTVITYFSSQQFYSMVK